MVKNLKHLRESRGISQQKLAEQFNTSQQSIYKYENGLAEPDIDMLKSFAEFFHTSIDYLVGYTDNMTLTNFTTLTQCELHHLELYRNLSSNMKIHFDAILEELYKKNNV